MAKPRTGWYRIPKGLPVMTRAAVLLAALIVSSGANSLRAQSAIDRLEEQLRGAAPGGGNQPNPAPSAAAEPGYLGMIADDRQENGGGLRILDVMPGGPAQTSGLKPGDLVKNVAGQPMRSMDDFAKIVGTLPAGAKLSFQLERNGATQQVDVTLGRRPPPGERRFEQFGAIPQNGGAPVPLEVPRPASLGVRVGPVTGEIQAIQGLGEGRGAYVVSIVEGSAAQKAGVPAGAVIVSLDGQPVNTPSDLARLVAQVGANAEIKLTYYQNGILYERRVKLEPAGGGQLGVAIPEPMVPRGTGPIGINPPAMLPPNAGPLAISPPAREPVGNPVVVNSAPSDSTRVEVLERRIAELERRLAEMEQELKAAKGK
jgi:membrane-associated protease RseP (regulator of RpoE activity)